MTLRDTVELMNSADYKERFIAEYQQLVIRYKGLRNMLDKWDRGGVRVHAYLSTQHLQYANQSND